MSARNGPHPLHSARLTFETLGKRCSNVYHFGEVVPHVVKDQGIDISARMRSWWTGGYGAGAPPADLCGNDAVLLSIAVQVAELLLEDPIIGDILDLLDFGLSMNTCLPNSVTYALEWTTGFSGRAGHGRTFAVGMALGSLDTGDQNLLTPEARDKFANAYSALIPAVHSWTTPPGGLCLALLHHAPHPEYGGLDPWWTPITGLKMPDRVIGSQRRRLPRVG